MKKILIISIFLISNSGLFSQNFEWAKSYGGLYTDYGYAITHDMQGNVYSVGIFLDTADFDPNVGVFNLTAQFIDSYIQKLDSNGNFIWAKSLRGNGAGFPVSNIYDVKIDNMGNVITIGIFDETVDFDPGPGTYNLTSGSNSASFVQKLDANGNFIWAKAIGGVAPDIMAKLFNVDGNDNIIVCGQYRNTHDFDPGPSVFNLTSNGGFDVFTVKLDSAGNFVWAKSIGAGGIDDEYVTGVIADGMDNVCIAGYFGSTMDFNPGPSVFNLSTTGSFDSFVLKLNVNGDFIWAKSFGGTGTDRTYDMDADLNGNIYSFGNFNIVADFDPGTGTANLTPNGNDDIYLQKIDSAGNFVWAKSIGGAGYDAPFALFVDDNGNAYSTGIFNTTVDFDPGAPIANLTAIGNTDMFVQKIDANGDFVWAKSFGGNTTATEETSSITVDDNGNTIVAGSFSDTADFDPGTPIQNLISKGVTDVFVLKLYPNVVASNGFEINKAENISIFPNPTSNYLKLNTEQKIDRVDVIDLTGRVINSFTQNSKTFNVQELPKGTYFIKVVGEKNTSISKFVKQ